MRLANSLASCPAIPMSTMLTTPTLTILLLAAATLAPAGQLVTVDGVPYVRNGAEPAEGRQVKQLEELWRIGGDNDDVFFGMITQVLADEAGAIYLLDSQLCEVQVYSPDGEHLKTLFREGAGPGEVSRPRNLCLLGDGTVGVIQEFPGRMVRVDGDNVPVSSIEAQGPDGGFVVLDGCFAGGPTLLFSGTILRQAEQGIQERDNFLSLYGLDGQERLRLASLPNQRDFNDFVFAERREMPSFFWATCVDRAGRVYTAPDRDAYRIEVRSPDGALERVVEREYEHLRRTDESHQRLSDALDAVLYGAPFAYRIEIERDEYDILTLQHGVRVREDGSLWVLPGRGAYGQPDGILLTFDVFDPAGHFVRQVSLGCPGNGVWDGLFFVGPDRAVVVTGHVEAMISQYADGGASISEDEDGGTAMEVICYRIP